MNNLSQKINRQLNNLTDKWVLVSPHRYQRFIALAENEMVKIEHLHSKEVARFLLFDIDSAINMMGTFKRENILITQNPGY